MNTKYFSSSEVAKLCNVSKSTIVRWIRDGRLPSVSTVGGHNRIDPKDLVSLLKALRINVPEHLKQYEETFLTSDSSGPTILIVDDESSFREMLSMLIRNDFEDVRLEEAWDGFSAGWRARVLKPDVIILDLMLPDIDGFRVCELIKGIPELEHTKVIALTGYGEEHRPRIMGLGAVEFLTKPLEWDSLRGIIEKHLYDKAA